jgi:hypothetical protein
MAAESSTDLKDKSSIKTIESESEKSDDIKLMLKKIVNNQQLLLEKQQITDDWLMILAHAALNKDVLKSLLAKTKITPVFSENQKDMIRCVMVNLNALEHTNLS